MEISRPRPRREGPTGQRSQQLILPEVHPLNDVATIVKDSPDVLRIHGTGEVGVAVVSAVAARCADSLQGERENTCY